MRRFISLLLIVAVFLVSGISVFAANFPDVPPSHPNYTAIIDLQERGIIDGYPDGTFGPEKTVNRVEALKILLLGAQIDVPEEFTPAKFIDTPANEWYSPFLAVSYDLGIVDGYPNGTFKPAQTVNLVEALKMLIEANDINLLETEVPFGEIDPYVDAYSDQWYGSYVWYARMANLIDRDREGKIYPSEGLSRGKLAEIIYRLIWLDEQNMERDLFDLPPMKSYRKEVLLDNLDVDNGSDRFDFESDWDDLVWNSNEIWLGSLAINGTWTRDVDWNVVDLSKQYLDEGNEWSSMEEVFDYYVSCPADPELYSTIDDPDGDGLGEPRRAYSEGVFCLLTSEGNFVKIEVIDAWSENNGDDKYLKFRYIFRPDGDRMIP